MYVRSEHDIILENPQFILTVGCDCIVKSLICRLSGEECLASGEPMALFSVTQERPFNNENKLIYANRRTTYQANRLRRESDRLIIGFETAPYEAIVEIVEKPMYISFELIDFTVKPEDYEPIIMDLPPVSEFRLLQLPVRNRERFGEWLNVTWDDQVSVNVLSTSPYARIGAKARNGFRIFSADAVENIKLQGCGAALIVSTTEMYLDCVASVEEDYDMPRGVESRRSEMIQSSILWTCNITPQNVDEYIKYAVKCGWRRMLIYYSSIFKEEKGYSFCGDYDYRPEYPAGEDDLGNVLEKLKGAGITPGIHFLHTHIGLKSRYVTPAADHRLHLKRLFTASRDLEEDDTVIYVEQNPQGAPLKDRCRVLRFGGELISYEGYSTERPYCFTGCSRGHLNTIAARHDRGSVGGVLDISEFSATSVYLDQNSDLQEEIAEKIAAAYNLGFEFVYFDGSEGTNIPFDFHIPNAQYRVYKKFKKVPIFCEGAAKAHFGWHMLSGGNAFDVFPTDIFKQKINEFPVKAAQHLRNDFTHVNFGWWEFRKDTQPDIYEYGMSRAAAWDCRVTVQVDLRDFKDNARTDDILEVLRRWEDVKAKNWLTQEQKEAMKDGKQEYTLLINEQGKYELVPYEYVAGAARNNENFRAFYFERCGRNYIVCWHAAGCGKLKLRSDAGQIICEREIGGEKIAFEEEGQYCTVPVSGRCYMSSALPKEEMLRAFFDAGMID